MGYPKKRKPSRKVTCEICGKQVYIRGYKAHRWLKHGIPQNTKVSNSGSNLGELGINESTQVRESVEMKSNEVIKAEKQVDNVGIFDEFNKYFLDLSYTVYAVTEKRLMDFVDISKLGYPSKIDTGVFILTRTTEAPYGGTGEPEWLFEFE